MIGLLSKWVIEQVGSVWVVCVFNYSLDWAVYIVIARVIEHETSERIVEEVSRLLSE